MVTYFAAFGLADGMWLARIPAVKQHLGLSDGMLGLALLAAPAGVVTVVMLVGRVVDRFGSARPTLLAGAAVTVLPVGFGLADSQVSLMGAFFAFGIAVGLLDVSANAQAIRVQRGYGRPLLTSFHACYSGGGIVGALLGGAFAWAGVAPATNFAAVGVPLAAVTLLAGRWLLHGPDGAQAGVRGVRGERGERAAAPEEAVPGPPRRLHHSGRLAVLGLLAFCCLLGEGAAGNWSAVYLRDSLGTSAAFAATGFAAFSVMMTAGRLAGDRLAARFGPARLVRGCGLLAAAGLAGALLSGSPAGAVAGFGLFGAGLSCTFPQLMSVAGSIEPARPGGALARVAGMGYLGLLSGPALIGGCASLVGLPTALGAPAVLMLGVALASGVLAARAEG